MAQKMSAAIAAEDWKMLAAINTLMASTLPQMAARGAWSAAEWAALAALRQMHEHAVQRCDQATEDVARKMKEALANQEGWMAYAMHSEQADIGIQA
jgi:hypothetical protein